MLELFRKMLQAIWRIWFYILVALPIFIFFPFLLLFTISERTFAQFFWMARNIWAPVILIGMGFMPRIRYNQNLVPGQSYMLVANHTSMLDIMMMLRVSRNPFVFVGKKELARIPVFGFFYKRVSILVDRDDSRSRSAVYRRARLRLQEGLSICIFPEGGVPDEAVTLDTFKDGAFRMAIDHRIPVVPVVFLDTKRRFPFRFFAGAPGKLRTRVLPFFETSALAESDKGKLRERVRGVILEQLGQNTG